MRSVFFRGLCLWTVLLSSSACSGGDKDPLDFGAARAAKTPATTAPKTTTAPSTPTTTAPKTTSASKLPHVQKKTLLASSSSSGVGTNLSELAEYASSWPFANAFKHARGWISTDGNTWDDGRAVSVDERGWVKGLVPGQKARALVVWGDGLEFPKGAWKVRWHGTGTIDFWPQGGVSTSKGEGSATLNADPKKGGIAVTITSTDALDPIRDIEVIVPGADPAASIFNPAFLARLKGYGALRFMDWMKTNHSTIATPAERPLLDDSRWLDKGIPVEVAFELCNVTGADCWINIGHTWSDELIATVARVAKAKLDPKRRLYVESSNEVWNGIFPQSAFAKQRAIAAEISKDSFEGQMRWHARRTVAIGAIFDDVFGADNARVVRVLGAWAANSWSTGIMLDEVKQQGAVVDAVAIAPYFGNSLGEPEQRGMVQGLGLEGLMQKVDAAVDESLGWVKEQKKVTDASSTWLISYEGGQHLMGVGPSAEDTIINGLFDEANRSARMKPIYARYLKGWKDSGAGLFMHFNDVMRPTKYGRWGSLETMSQPRDQAPKYDALMSFIETTPRWF